MQAVALCVVVAMAASASIAAIIRTHRRSVNRMNSSGLNSELIFLGTGVSTGLPRVSCIIDPKMHCPVCDNANKQQLGKNRRCNVMVLVRLGRCSVLIDCGKTLRESVLRWAERFQIDGVDGVCLTHGHADAILGLDDLSGVQKQTFRKDNRGRMFRVPKTVPIFLNEETMDACRRCFPYLMPWETNSRRLLTGKISSIEWKPFKESQYYTAFKPVKEAGIKVTPIPLWHRKPYVCMGYIVSGSFEKDSVIAYLSDVSEVPEKTLETLKSLKRLDILVVDALQWTRVPSHFSVSDAISLAKILRPRRTLLVGMSCSLGMHERVNEDLAKLKYSDELDVSLAYDGLRIPL